MSRDRIDDDKLSKMSGGGSTESEPTGPGGTPMTPPGPGGGGPGPIAEKAEDDPMGGDDPGHLDKN